MSQAVRFRELIASHQPIVVAGAHNGLSAKLVMEAGFEGIWASGFEISASHGIPDANILSVADNLALARQMVEAVGSRGPVVADCDNGYGNAINVIHMVRQYEAAGIAAVSIEDNVFPKRCSFYAGVERELAAVEEHAGKIRAAKEAQRTSEFVVIARTEALIAGWGMEEALRRARAYAEAGADMILVHSKAKDPGEILHFAKAWDRKVPLVCVPTTYKTTSVSTLYEAGYKMIIFANQGLRSALKAMRETLGTLRATGVPASVDATIAPMNAVYELVGVERMNEEERTYMPAGVGKTTAVILAAGPEKTFGPMTEGKPRAMLDIRGKTILERQIEVLNRCNIKEIAVVRGYKKEEIDLSNVRTYDNDDYDTTGEVVSLFKASGELDRRVVILYGDILFEQSVLEKLLRSTADVTVVVDRSLVDRTWEERRERVRDYVIEEAPADEVSHHRFVPSDGTRLVQRIGAKIPPREANGEFIGMTMLTEKGCRVVQDVWSQATDRPDSRFHEATCLAAASVTDLLQEVSQSGTEVRAVDIYKGWMEIDSFEDYQRAWASLP